MRILKFPIQISDEIQKIIVPKGSFVTLFAQQPTDDFDPMRSRERNMQVWIACPDNTTQSEEKSFRLVGTGHAFGEVVENVFTALDPPFVWHLLELRKPG